MHLLEPRISWKSTCQDTWLRKPQKFQENAEHNILGNKSWSQKGAKRWATGFRGDPLPRAHLGAQVGPAPGPCGPSPPPLRRIIDPWPKYVGGIDEEFFRRLHEAETRQREEELRQGEISDVSIIFEWFMLVLWYCHMFLLSFLSFLCNMSPM